MSSFNLKSYFTFLSRNKTYTAVNVFGLAVSLTFVIIIGLYTWQETSINRQHTKADRIYNIGLEFMDDSSRVMGCHHASLRNLRMHYPEIENTCGMVRGSIKVRDRDDVLNVNTINTDSTFFSMFDFKLLRGDRATCLSNKGNIVVTEQFAHRYFGTDDVLGRTIMTTDSLHFRVTGVVQNFDNTIISKNTDALVDFAYAEREGEGNMDKYFPGQINVTNCACFVQVRKGCDLMQKEADIQKFWPTFWPYEPAMPIQPFLTPLNKLYFNDTPEVNVMQFGNINMVKILLAVGLVILLFSIMNYINLTVAQCGYRARETATRRLFGCSKTGISINMFSESLIMCAFSCVIAAAMTIGVAGFTGSIIGKDIDTGMLATPWAIAAILLFVVVVSLLAGVIPATVLSRVKPIEVVRGTLTKHTKMIFSRIFITTENLITIVLLSCALIMMLQMNHLINAPIGFNKDNIISIFDPWKFNGNNLTIFLDKLRALPCIEKTTNSCGSAVYGGNSTAIAFEGDKTQTPVHIFNVTPEFMEIYGITPKNGGKIQSGNTLYLNDEALELLHMKPTDTHLSRRYKSTNSNMLPADVRYGGMINNFHTTNILQPISPYFIFINDQIEYPWYVTIKVKGDPIDALNEVKKVYKEVFREEMDTSRPVFVTDQIAEIFEKDIRTSKIVSLFAFIAIIISLLGLVAMSTYFIQQRAREIAIRKVFGSTGNQIRLRLIRTFMLYVSIAFVIAVPIVAHFMSKWIDLYSYRIVWWPCIVAAGAIVMLISLADVAVQSWMASNENPVKNIRQE
ncbi:ABC transporter permease [uncultured Prevotella sp.]|uniref:ABC transporter permease n=1 Tax=uncultured Prevotella sp. TaxID=159272 RepID=UPI002625D00F|nr:ABC transporter permease [uncultured Prevotella sp.]